MSAGIVASLSSIKPVEEPKTRTEWAEREVQHLLSAPFISEFVFRSPRTRDGRTEHEIADFLIRHGTAGVLIQQKCQEDPESRTAPNTDLWVTKNAKDAWRQLRRSLTRPQDRPIWCDHPRLGRVDFPDGLPSTLHGIVIVETRQPVNLQGEADNLPLVYKNIPITYLSVNDFLNLADNLRTVPELIEYLSARRFLPEADLRVVGEGKALLSFYFLNGGSFDGCAGLADARAAVAAQRKRLAEVIAWKRQADRYAGLLEHVADALATRHPDFERDLPRDVGLGFDPGEKRVTYLDMQAAIADLRLRERAFLGEAFAGAMEKLAHVKEGFVFRSARLDSKPDWVYIFGSSKAVARAELLSRIPLLMSGAMAYYEKRRCLVVIDRDTVSYEVALSRADVQPTAGHFETGQRFFGGLRVTSSPLELSP